MVMSKTYKTPEQKNRIKDHTEKEKRGQPWEKGSSEPEREPPEPEHEPEPEPPERGPGEP